VPSAPHFRASIFSLTSNHKIDGLRAFALFVRLDIETNPLTLIQILKACLFNRGDVYKDISSAIVRLNKTVASFPIKELDDASLCHRETPSTSLRLWPDLMVGLSRTA